MRPALPATTAPVTRSAEREYKYNKVQHVSMSSTETGVLYPDLERERERERDCDGFFLSLLDLSVRERTVQHVI